MTSRAKCHCGAIVVELLDVPDKVVECNCSICRRLGSLWVYRPLEEVVLSYDEGATSTYVWGDRRIEFHTCRICGCTTHWLPLIDEYTVLGINARMIDGLCPSDVEIVHEDYGETGCFWS
jgi:hypothetical protein